MKFYPPLYARYKFRRLWREIGTKCGLDLVDHLAVLKGDWGGVGWGGCQGLQQGTSPSLLHSFI